VKEMTDVPTTNSGYDKRDVNVRATILIGAVIVVVIAAFLIVLSDFFVLKKEQMMYDYVMKPESAPLRDLRAREMEVLTTYKLLDPAKGIYRIPLSRAMELMADEAYRDQQKGRQ
jgi:hypothetical protein